MVAAFIFSAPAALKAAGDSSPFFDCLGKLLNAHYQQPHSQKSFTTRSSERYSSAAWDSHQRRTSHAAAAASTSGGPQRKHRMVSTGVHILSQDETKEKE